MIRKTSAAAAQGALKALAVRHSARQWRLFSVTSSAISSAPSSAEPLLQSSEPTRAYSEIPTKKGLPLLGNLLEYSSKGVRSKLYNLTRKRFEELGLIFRERFVSTFPEMVVTGDPRDVEAVFRSEGKWPFRPNIEIWEKVRKDNAIPLGLLLSQDYEDWHRQRQPISQFMMVPRKVGSYHQGFNAVAQDFVKFLKLERDPVTGLITDIPNHFFKWSFESIALFTLGKRLGCLEHGNIPHDCQEFIQQVQQFLTASQDLLFGLPLHKFFPTKSWNMLVESQTAAYKIAMQYIEEKIREIKEKDMEVGKEHHSEEDTDFLTHMIHNAKISLEEISINAGDLLGAGVDTTSLTLVWCLYCLAKNPEVQEKLRGEVMSVVGGEEIVTPAHINDMPYLRHCIKETHRLYPIAPNNTRILRKDLVLSGYRVPAGALVLMPILVIGTLPQNFSEPECFQPERWERDEIQQHQVHRFASLPFGFGPRMCIGRRVAELELHITLAHLMKNFHIAHPQKEEIEPLQKIFLVPEHQLDLTFSNV